MSFTRTRWVGALTCLLPLVVFGVWPLCALAREASFETIDFARLSRTVKLAALAALGAVLLGGPLGWAAARAGRGAVVWKLFQLSPLLLPPVLVAQGWTVVLRPDGAVATAWAAFGGSNTTPIEALESIPGAAFVLAICGAPIVLLLVESALGRVPATSFDAAASLGASRLRAFHVAAGAALRRALFSGATIVFILACGECGVPTLLEVDVLGFDVLVRLAAFPDFGAATAAAWPLAALGVCAYALSRRFADGERGRDVIDSTDPAAARPRHRLAPILLAGAASLFVLPPYLTWGAAIDAPSLHAAFELAQRPFGATLRSAGWVAATCSILALLLAFSGGRATRDLPARISGLAIWLAIALLATPSVLLGLGVSAISWIPDALALPGVLFAHHVAIAWLVLAPRLRALPREGLESASGLGATPLAVMGRVAFPVLSGAMFAAFLLVFAFAAQDLGATALLHAPGEETLVVALLSLEANSPRGVVAAYALLSTHVLVPVGLAGWLALVTKKKSGAMGVGLGKIELR